jgi:putative ABC transport system permease protein
MVSGRMSLLRDARFGFRLLVKNPGFAAVAVLALALGIGATTAIFSVVYATYFEPLPYRDAERLVMLWSRHEGNRNNVSAQDLVEWRRQATVFEDLNAWNGREVNLSTGSRPELITAGRATPGFLAMLGYGQPVFLGRNFLEEEGTPGRGEVAILSHRLWQERFGGDPSIVGRAIRLDAKSFTVVGVLSPGPADHNMNRLYTPLVVDPTHEQHQSRWLLVMGRLKPGVTFAQANAEMAGVAADLARRHPDTHTGWTASVEPFRNNFVSDDTKKALWLLLGAVAFVLLIACANVANLMLARGASRQRELAVRASLGASRAAVIRQLITESLVLALLGGALGVALAYALVDVIVALMPPFTLPTEVDIRLSVPVLLFTLAACTLSGVLFGAAPAWQAARTDLNTPLKDAGRSVTGGHLGFRRALVVLEFALALTLLTGGGLAVRSFFRLASVDLGLRPEHVLTFTLPMAQGRLDGPQRIDAFYRDLLERVRALPGVTSASLSTTVPMRPGQWSLPFSVVGRPQPDPSKRPQTGFNVVTPAFHETLGIRIVRGRAFSERDRAGSLPVAVVNETFVRRYLPDVDPVGQRVVFAYVPGVEGPAREWEIVGVSADVRAGGPRNEGSPAVVLPFAQAPWPRPNMAVRTAGDPTAVQDGIATVVASLDGDLPLGNIKTMEQLVSERMAGDRFNMALFAGFAAVALVLAAVGIYGVMAFVVAQRTREIGVRMALGAGRGRVLADVLGEGMATALAGTALGATGAWLVARAMQGLLHGTPGLDPLAFTAVAGTLLAAALAACVVPARRAASVDPLVAFRQE